MASASSRVIVGDKALFVLSKDGSIGGFSKCGGVTSESGSDSGIVVVVLIVWNVFLGEGDGSDWSHSATSSSSSSSSSSMIFGGE